MTFQKEENCLDFKTTSPYYETLGKQRKPITRIPSSNPTISCVFIVFLLVFFLRPLRVFEGIVIFSWPVCFLHVTQWTKILFLLLFLQN